MKQTLLFLSMILFAFACTSDNFESDQKLDERGKYTGPTVPPNPYGKVFPGSLNCNPNLSPSEVDGGPCFYADAMIENLNKCSQKLIFDRFGDGFSGPLCYSPQGCESAWEIDFQAQTFPPTNLPPVCTTGCPPKEQMHYWNSNDACTGSNQYVIEDWVMDGADVANALTIALELAEAAAAQFESECPSCTNIVPYSVEWEVTWGVCDHPCEFSICPESGLYYISNGPDTPINRLTPKIKFCCTSA